MLTLWRPHNELLRWSRELDSFFNSGNGSRSLLSPDVDIEETEEGFVITADLPGVEEKNIEVTVKGGVLTLSGHREESSEEKQEGRILRERSYGAFRRSVRLSDTVDVDNINATYHDGVLSLSLPKLPEALPKQITVKQA